MLQFLISALITILPDYLYRRYGQGKRFGEEITLSNFLYEFRWGITAFVVVTAALLFFGGEDKPGSPKMIGINPTASVDELPFFITSPAQTDGLLIAVALALVLIVVGLGGLYFWIQAWPDRLARGATRVQLQIVGILGLISLFTLNNAFWIAGVLLATIRFPDFITPLKDIAKALSKTTATKS